MTNEKELREQLKNHICRFNDFPQECECFKAGFHSHTKEVVEKILPKVQKFIDKVESGKARSVETYADMKEIREFLASLEDNKK